MNRLRKRYAPMIVIAATILTALAWSWQSLNANATSAANAAADLATCQRLAARVATLSKTAPQDSAATELAAPDLAHLIESASTTAEIPPGSLIRIAPEPPRTREGRPYQEQSTEVVFHAVTVEQTVCFLYALSTAAPNVRPTNLRLLVPTEGAQSGATTEGAQSGAATEDAQSSATTEAAQSGAITEDSQSGATWNAEIRLTRLIYTPAAPQKLTGLQP